MTDANTNGTQAVNSGTNQQATGENNAIIPETGTNLDNQHNWKQYGENETDALANLTTKADAWDKKEQDMNSRLEKMEERLMNKEDFINQQAQELGQARQSGQSAEILANVSQNFSDIMEGEDATRKLGAVSDIAKWEVQQSQIASREARNAFYTAIENDSDLNTKSFDWLRHKADVSGVSLDKIATVKNMKSFLSQVKPRKTVNESALREAIRKEVEADFNKKNLAVGTNIPAGNGQVQGARVEGGEASDLSQEDFLAKAFQSNQKRGTVGL